MNICQRLKNYRAQHISRLLFKKFKTIQPPISPTEQAAIQAGTVDWDAQLFSGSPDWSRLHRHPTPKLTHKEQAFIENQCKVLCDMVNEWEASTLYHDLAPQVWNYIKQEKFMGMIIPESFGGLGFSAFAHSEVIARLASRGVSTAVTVMVPNSLGPAELLLHYGTQEQKDFYLPRLATGEEIPAFALTSPWAGSDAAAIPDQGVVCYGQWQGQEVLGISLSFDKRYITLAPCCTVFGLAFHLYDPQHLLGDRKDLGITCALIPREHPGVKIGRRHFPLNAVFMNGPIQGQDVFIPFDFMIGGKAMIGQGWTMLMECLAAGRAISLPSSHTGMMQNAVRYTSAYTRVRKQFNLAIGRFEGVGTPLAQMAANTYIGTAMRYFTTAAIDNGEKPAIASAIAKLHITERARQTANHTMDILGGKGICLGPSNIMGRIHQQVPIGITVEGANILTRNLIIFGQGALRCHPYLLKEIQAAQMDDEAQALQAFDRAFWGHMSHGVQQFFKLCGNGVFGSSLNKVGIACHPDTKRYYQQISRLACVLAVSSELTMTVLGSSLKKRENLSARLGDMLSELYLASACLYYFKLQEEPEDDLPFVHHAVQNCLHNAQTAFIDLCDNLPSRWLRIVLKRTALPWGSVFKKTPDRLNAPVLKALSEPSPTRERLVKQSVYSDSHVDPMYAVEQAFHYTILAEPIDTRLKQLQKTGQFKTDKIVNVHTLTDIAYELNFINKEEHRLLSLRDQWRDRVIHVDDFPNDLSQAHNAFQDFSVRSYHDI